MLSFISAQDDILPCVNQMVFLAPLILINFWIACFIPILLTSAPDVTRHRRSAQKERRAVLKREINADPLFAGQGKCRKRIAPRRVCHATATRPATETRAQTPGRGATEPYRLGGGGIFTPCGRVRARLRALSVVPAARTPCSVRFVSIPIPNIRRAVYHTPSRGVNARKPISANPGVNK